MENGKVSIIVPVYNMEKFIVRCLDSLRHQTYRNIEVVVIDDGSRDLTGSIIDNYVNVCGGGGNSLTYSE